MGHTRWRNFLFFQAVAAHICASLSAASVSITFESGHATKCYGRVQIDNGSILERFCDDRWDFNISQVLCRESNCGNALKPQVEPKSKTPDFSCKGDESSFGNCKRTENKTQQCETKAYVVCSGTLSQPRISLELPNGTVVESGQAEIPRGSSFVFSCSVASSTLNSVHFHLRHNGTTTETSPPTNSISVPFGFPVADYKHDGNYSCMYTVQLHRNYMLSETGWIQVIITEPWWMVLLYVLPAGILGLLVVLLVVCLTCRRRRRVVKLRTAVLNQMSDRNSYIDEDDEEDEMDYVNVDPANTKSQRVNEAGEESNAKEQRDEDSYDDEHDYEEPNDGPGAAVSSTKEQRDEEDTDDEHDYVQPNEGFVAGSNREEETYDESSTDDEQDYVNMVEQIVDIYGENYIYQNL
ncbi:deleted in malignant brain tumors 1 protein isoform X2 [Fundulus heteroclitus]|uniref:deleted in malignant brain tumors 1 protein isoform X2 n=1 Tax=Fundulus heteroclitus TaxID=8078 RepID=UPI00165B350D|nr:deleted in malignant brain tumors 1 protein isoform X2 [Fundulus heteroclitus]